MVNYVHAFTKVHGVHDNLFRAVAQMFFGRYDELGSLRFVAGKGTVCGRLPGQPRLDSGSLPAGWFPLPDAVARAFGLPPVCPLQSVFDVP